MPPELDLGLILIVFACVIVGFLVGAALTYAWSRRKIRALKAVAPIPAAPPVETPPQEPPARAIPEPAAANLPLVGIWRDQPAGTLRLEMEGRSFPAATDLSTSQRALMVEIMRQWVAWMGLQTAKPAAQPAQPAPVPAATPVASTPLAAEGEKKSFYRPRTMVEEIDMILAEMQSNLPPNVTRVKLMGDMQRGIVAWIGLEHYEGIDNIPNEEYRQLVRRAVAEWERRAG